MLCSYWEAFCEDLLAFALDQIAIRAEPDAVPAKLKVEIAEICAESLMSDRCGGSRAMDGEAFFARLLKTCATRQLVKTSSIRPNQPKLMNCLILFSELV